MPQKTGCCNLHMKTRTVVGCDFSEACVHHRVTFQVQRVRQLLWGIPVPPLPVCLQESCIFGLNLLLCESVLQLFCSLLLSRPQLCSPPLFFQLIPQGSGVLRAFMSKSVEQLLLVSLRIYHLKDVQCATHFPCNTEQIWEAGGRQAAVL